MTCDKMLDNWDKSVSRIRTILLELTEAGKWWEDEWFKHGRTIDAFRREYEKIKRVEAALEIALKECDNG